MTMTMMMTLMIIAPFLINVGRRRKKELKKITALKKVLKKGDALFKLLKKVLMVTPE